jgi:hypothetical protein
VLLVLPVAELVPLVLAEAFAWLSSCCSRSATCAMPLGRGPVAVGSDAPAGSLAVAELSAVVPAALGWPDWAFSRIDCSSEANFWMPEVDVSGVLADVLAELAELDELLLELLELPVRAASGSWSWVELALDAWWWPWWW